MSHLTIPENGFYRNSLEFINNIKPFSRSDPHMPIKSKDWIPVSCLFVSFSWPFLFENYLMINSREPLILYCVSCLNLWRHLTKNINLALTRILPVVVYHTNSLFTSVIKYRGVTHQSDAFDYYLTHNRVKRLVTSWHTLGWNTWLQTCTH